MFALYKYQHHIYTLCCACPGEDYTVEQSYEKEERLQQRQLEFLGALSSDIDM